MNEICDAIGFVLSLRWKLRFGKLSRSPMRLLRFQLNGELAECDWIARSPDPWDSVLPEHQRQQHATSQALQDAIAVRELLFRSLPEIQSAEFRVYRDVPSGESELVIAGLVDRSDEVAQVPSLAMRARLYGLRFWLDDGVLVVLEANEFVSQGS